MKMCKVCSNVSYDYEVQCRMCGAMMMTSHAISGRGYATHDSAGRVNRATIGAYRSNTKMLGLGGAKHPKQIIRVDWDDSTDVDAGRTNRSLSRHVRKSGLACGYGQGRYSPRWGRMAGRMSDIPL